jgi:hypothetical protein
MMSPKYHIVNHQLQMPLRDAKAESPYFLGAVTVPIQD